VEGFLLPLTQSVSFPANKEDPVLQKYSISLHQMQKQKRLTESLKHSGQEKTPFHISHQS
jgi:hypothetical protein